MNVNKNKIEQYCAIKNTTPTKLAEKIGISRANMWFYCTGNYVGTKLTISNAQKIAKELDCSLIDVLGTNAITIEPKNDDERLELIKLIAESIENVGVKEEIIKCVKNR